MKKLLPIYFLIICAYGQTILQESFNNLGAPLVLPSGWTMTNQSQNASANQWFRGNPAVFVANSGDTNGYIAANFAAVASGVGTISTWLISPNINVKNGDEISFFTRTAGTYPDRLELRMSTLGNSSTSPEGPTGVGSYSTLCLSVNPALLPNIYPLTWTKYNYVVSGLSGPTNCKFAFRYFVTNGGPSGANSNYIGVDDFEAKTPVANNIELVSVNVPAIIQAGNINFGGSVKNVGNNTITSYQVTWQANGGMVNTHNVTGLNLLPGAFAEFSHSVPLNAVVGTQYNLNFNIPTVNGGADGDPINNSLTRQTVVASGATAFKPLIEKFTSSTCPPCASYNNNTFNPFFNNTYSGGSYNYIAYQLDFPGAGDPYYTAEAGTRSAYYSINAITALRIDGQNYSTGNNQTALTNHINTLAAKSGYFDLSANRNVSQPSNNVEIYYSITPYISGNYNLYAVLYEKTTTGNIASNGETSFKHVMMKMVPNANGTPLSLATNQPVSGTISAGLSSTFIEDFNDLEVVVFLQNEATKEIMQSARATNILSSDSFQKSKLSLIPNPATDFFRLNVKESVSVAIVDISGKTIAQFNQVDSSTDINIAKLNSGIYFVNILGNETFEPIKLIKK